MHGGARGTTGMLTVSNEIRGLASTAYHHLTRYGRIAASMRGYAPFAPARPAQKSDSSRSIGPEWVAHMARPSRPLRASYTCWDLSDARVSVTQLYKGRLVPYEQHAPMQECRSELQPPMLQPNTRVSVATAVPKRIVLRPCERGLFCRQPAWTYAPVLKSPLVGRFRNLLLHRGGGNVAN
jgi:hypothetical protein